MNTHIRVLAVLEIVYASIGLLFSVGMLALFGGIAAVVGINAPVSDASVAVPIIAAVGTVAAAFFGILSLPRLIAGIGLLHERSWARTLTIVISAIGLFDVPVGLALGVYGLVVMFNMPARNAAHLEPSPVRTA